MIHYTTALIVLSATAVVYQNLVTPLMQPPQIESIAPANQRIYTADQSLHDLFPAGAWQRGECRQLKTSNMTLLFQIADQKSQDKLLLSPITVVVGQGLSAEKEPNPIIIEASEGAEITFARALNVLSSAGGAPPIHHGRISGPVHIHRAESDTNPPFEIHTSNVGIDNRRVWTSDEINMRVGDANCTGRDLTIHLATPTAAGGGRGETALDRMELIYLDQLSVPLQGKLFGGHRGLAEAPDHQAPAIVSVNCDGRVEYDFAIDQLTLRDTVSFVHQPPGLPADEFHCELLKIKLNDPTNPAITRTEPLDWLIEIIASGSPASAKIPSYDAHLLADRIEFHAIKGLVNATGKAGVEIRRGGITARLANLVYQFDPQNMQSLGAIDVQGAGIVRVRDAKIPLREVRWRDRFKLFPVQATTTKRWDSEIELQIDGDFHAWLTDGGEIQADSVAGVLVPSPVVGNPAAGNPADGNPAAGDPPATTLQPDRFIAHGQVRIDTTAISAETKQLYVQLVDDPGAGKAAVPAGSGDASPLRQWVSQPGDAESITAPVARDRPVIRGDTINVQLRRNADGLSAKKLSIVGSVNAEHRMMAGGQSLPVTVTGERLQLVNGGSDDVLQIVGGIDTPARFDFGDGFFIGPQIQIRPADNTVSINSAGEFQIPTAALPVAFTDQSDASIRWTTPPHCRWNGEMWFDGRTARLTGGVQINASLINNGQPSDLVMTGDRLQLDLTAGIEVNDVQSMRSATIRSVSLLGGQQQPVLVQAIQTAADGVTESKHLLQAAKLTYSPSAGGGLVGQGPGWYRGWFLPQHNSSIGLPSADDGLTGVHLIFGESMQADLSLRALTFQRGVRVGIRQVPDWDQAFDAAAMDAISTGESTLDCDQLRFAVTPGFERQPRPGGLPIPWEVEARHGVVFRTRNENGLIEGTASRAAYASGKQLFTADGAPNRPSIVQQTRPDGSPGLNMRSRTVTIHLGTMTIVDHELEGFSVPTQ